MKERERAMTARCATEAPGRDTRTRNDATIEQLLEESTSDANLAGSEQLTFQ